MMSPDDQARLLAEWLESHPGEEPPAGLDPDVVETVYALRPDLAPAPRLDLDDLLGSVASGPLAAPGEVLPFPEAAPHEPAEVAPLSSRRRWAAAGTMLALAAAVVLVVLAPRAAREEPRVASELDAVADAAPEPEDFEPGSTRQARAPADDFDQRIEEDPAPEVVAMAPPPPPPPPPAREGPVSAEPRADEVARSTPRPRPAVAPFSAGRGVASGTGGGETGALGGAKAEELQAAGATGGDAAREPAVADLGVEEAEAPAVADLGDEEALLRSMEPGAETIPMEEPRVSQPIAQNTDVTVTESRRGVRFPRLRKQEEAAAPTDVPAAPVVDLEALRAAAVPPELPLDTLLAIEAEPLEANRQARGLAARKEYVAAGSTLAAVPVQDQANSAQAGFYFLQAGEPDDARGVLSEALAVSPANTPQRAWLLVLFGDAARREGDVAAAESAYRQAQRLNAERLAPRYDTPASEAASPPR